MVNPYNDAKELSAWKWMMKYHIKQMVFTFLFIGMFMVAPWVGKWRVEETWLAILITACATILNVLATWLHPYLIYRDNLKGWYRWERNKDAGMYD